MKPDPIDDTGREPTAADVHNFTKHSHPVEPISPEEDIETEASNVVPVVPLPERKQTTQIQAAEDHDARDIKQSNINKLSAEDFYEGDL